MEPAKIIARKKHCAINSSFRAVASFVFIERMFSMWFNHFGIRETFVIIYCSKRMHSSYFVSWE